jgi:hypothetical protein
MADNTSIVTLYSRPYDRQCDICGGRIPAHSWAFRVSGHGAVTDCHERAEAERLLDCEETAED